MDKIKAYEYVTFDLMDEVIDRVREETPKVSDKFDCVDLFEAYKVFAFIPGDK